MLLAPDLWPGTLHNRGHSMEEENAGRLKEKKVSVLTILVGEGDECDALAPFGPVVRLEDAVGTCGRAQAPSIETCPASN